MSLRFKLVLSYLGVALGAIFIMAWVTALAVQKYFDSTQLNALNREAAYRAQSLEYFYQRQGSTWGNGLLVRSLPNDPVLLVVVDSKGHPIVCSQPDFLAHFHHNNGNGSGNPPPPDGSPGSSDDSGNNNCSDSSIQHALMQTLSSQQQTTGSLSLSAGNQSISSLYITIPLVVNNQVIGAMFLSEPQIYPNAFPGQVNSAIVLTSLIVALIVILFSLLLASRLTLPLKLLTIAAEQVKQGKYTQRVAPPKSEDEIGRLALTFNEMADTIETDVNELRRQEQARRELLANIAHDLATPLTAIQGFSEALADDVISEREERQETAQRIAREVQRLRRMVADLQQMTSLESGQTRLDLAPLNIHTLVDETLSVIAPECEQMAIRVRNDISPTIPLVLADSDRITQVLLNLLDNARRHTPHEGTIRVGALVKPQQRYLYVWVEDTGVGINPYDLPHIFERFYRADRSRTGATGGSGLGLSIVKAIITAHGGTIHADSIPDRGTRITFTLPLA